MLELIQIPYSPFCIVQRRILEFAGVRFKIVNIPVTDRSLVWRLTRQRYYQVPTLKDGRQVIFETSEESQVIAKYLDEKLGLGLFPPELRGLQSILWRSIESEIEGVGFKLNDIYFEEFIPARERLGFIRHKERRFGRHCIEQWGKQQDELLAALAHALLPFDQTLEARAFLLGDRPRFVDFDLFGMLGNFLYTGHYQLPPAHRQLQAWYERMAKTKLADFPSEKLHP